MSKSKAAMVMVDDHLFLSNALPELVSSEPPSHLNHIHDTHQPVRSLTMLSEREKEFLKLACTEMTYKEIAEKMFLSARTIDGYRDALFEKLNVKSRVGLVMYAIRSGIVSL